MATQSTLTISSTGDQVGADASGNHPTGNLNANWIESVDDNALRFTADTIMADVAAGTYHTSSAADYYSEVLCLGPLMEGMRFEIGSTGDAQLTACWQWYNPATSGVDADFVSAAPGTASTFGNGTWTDIGTAAQDYDVAALHGAYAADVAALDKGTMLRVKLVVTDAGSDGITHTIINVGVAAVNAAYCTIPFDKDANNNLSMVEQYSGQTTAGSISGNIGADAS